MSTSGTTGGPMPVYYDKRFWDNVVADLCYRNMKFMDCNPWDTSLTIRYATSTHNIHNNEGELRNQTKHRSRGREALGFIVPMFRRWRKTTYIAYNADEIINDVVGYKPKIIKGNTSYLKLLAEAIANKGSKGITLKALLSMSEVLDNPSRNFLESFFGCKVYDGYGANELGSIARECSRRNGLHIKADMVIVEVLRNGKPAAPGGIW
jgi:phenylacetate-coenzyme A ligase PaaK-like adenylate-forming protein